MKNCVLVTAYTNCDDFWHTNSPFKSKERFEQLVDYTIPSVLNCIPDPEIYLIEGTQLTSEQLEKINSFNIKTVCPDNYFATKSMGELRMLKNFVNLFDTFNYNSFTKLSGRYNVTFTKEFFNSNEFLFSRHTSYSNGLVQCIETFFYKFPNSYFKTFKGIISNTPHAFIDLEHTFEEQGIFKGIEGVEKLYVTLRVGAEGNTCYR